MSTRRRISTATAITGALTLAIASVAAATPVDLLEEDYSAVTDTTRWYVEADRAFTIIEARISDGVPGADGVQLVNNDAFDGVWAIVFGPRDTDADGDFDMSDTPDYYGAISGLPQYIVDVTTTAEGDVVVQGPVESHFGLDVTVQHRYYAAGDLARVLVTYTNPTAAPITITTGTDSNYGSDSSTLVDADSSGNGVVDLPDRWIVTSEDVVLTNDPVITTAWAGPGAGVTPSDIGWVLPGYLTTDVELTVAPGTSVSLAYFSLLNGWTSPASPPIQPPLQDEVPAEVVEGAEVTAEVVEVVEAAEVEVAAAAAIAADQASAVTAAIAGVGEFGSFSGRLTAGIPSGTRVLNWGTVGGAAPATPVVGAPRFTG